MSNTPFSIFKLTTLDHELKKIVNDKDALQYTFLICESQSASSDAPLPLLRTSILLTYSNSTVLSHG